MSTSRDHRNKQEISRRRFVGQTLAGTVAIAGGLPGLGAAVQSTRRLATDEVVLGKSGVKVTRIGMGTGSMGGRVQRDLGQESFTRLVRHAYDRGIRFIDTADNYKTHELVGKAIRGIPRETLAIQSKMRWQPFVPDTKQTLATLDRFRRELGVEYIDTLLIHCATEAGWPGSLEAMREGLARAKEKGIIRAHGVSCHGLPALGCVAACDWVDVNLARINHRGHHMDGDTGKWAEPGKKEPSCEHIATIHAAGKGVIGMKLIGNGDFTKPEEREKSIRFVMSRPYVDAGVIGFKSPAEVDEAIRRVNAALAG